MPTPRRLMASSVVENIIYTFGGYGAPDFGKSIPAFEVYSTGTLPEDVSPMGKLTTTWSALKQANLY